MPGLTWPRFNFTGADQEKKCGMLSGGERNRLQLAFALKQEGNVLLLDEPTNDIDVNTLRALEEGLDSFAGCAVVISHDRWFLDRIATHILSFEGDSTGGLLRGFVQRKIGRQTATNCFQNPQFGDYAAGLNDEELRTASRICEKGLRYDLTVPFARYVVQHQSEIAFPFKRYQIQPVWRADRPQKGRYREFYQCDVDVIGTRSLLCEVELIQIVERVFRTLGINVSLKVNNRKILYGIAETIGHADKMIDITVAIDKLEKIGLDAVKAELTERGIGSDAIEKLQPILELTGDNERKLAVLREVIGSSIVGLEGISEMETIFGYVNRLGVELPIELDFSLARGLNYYTGAIFEVKALDFAIGSICGGGRYDDLTGIFGMPNMSGVGISFGADRIYDVMTGLGLFPADLGCAARVMFANLGEAEEHASLKLLQEVRAAGIPAEIYPENGKMKKQMEYANRRGIPCVVIVGSRELEERVATIKDMTSGEQTQVPFTRLAEALR